MISPAFGAMLLLACELYAAAFTARCIYVVDGDTIDVRVDSKTFRIRLEGIDCPESSQDLGRQAKSFTESTV